MLYLFKNNKMLFLIPSVLLILTSCSNQLQKNENLSEFDKTNTTVLTEYQEEQVNSEIEVDTTVDNKEVKKNVVTAEPNISELTDIETTGFSEQTQKNINIPVEKKQEYDNDFEENNTNQSTCVPALPWGTTADLNVAEITKILNDYAASLPNTVINYSLSLKDSWTHKPSTYNRRSINDLITFVKSFIDLQYQRCASSGYEIIQLNILAVENFNVSLNATYYNFYILYG